MHTDRLIEALSRPEAFPHPGRRVRVVQTHISVVFLVGRFAYKVKKPVSFGFLDFRTQELRRHFCEEELRLNRRLAPSVYRRVLPVTQEGDSYRVGGRGPVVDWAVEMRRLSRRATLLSWLERGGVQGSAVAALARRIAAFHGSAEGGTRVARYGRWDVVARNAWDNLEQARRGEGRSVSSGVLSRLEVLFDQALQRGRSTIEERARKGRIRDTHGDLHLDHVYWFPTRKPPDNWIVIDCIEFNERFRFADPVADAAFLVMDFAFRGRRDLGALFADTYFASSGDEQGRELLPFYTAYRAAVRAKVDALASEEEEIPDADRAEYLSSARSHWVVALDALERPSLRPCLLGIGGLPGTGKSTLARSMAQSEGFHVIASDVVRKELAGDEARRPAADPQSGIYSAQWTERTYRTLFDRAEEALFRGERVLVDATFREARWRQAFFDLARRWSVRALLLRCETPTTVARERLCLRRADISDADWNVYQWMRADWEPDPATLGGRVVPLDTGKGSTEASEAASRILTSHDLAGAGRSGD